MNTPQHSEERTGLPGVPEWTLVAAVRDGDEAAVRELVRRFNPRLFRVARGIVGSDAEAEDVVQEAYLHAFTRLESFRGEARFSTWITRITLNAAGMRVRRARPQETYDSVREDARPDPSVLPFPNIHAEDPEARLDRIQLRGILEEAVGNLPAELRLPFLLRESEGLSVSEIARDLSLNVITVRTRLFRARRRLRACIEKRVQGGFGTIFPFDGVRCSRMADLVVSGLRRRGRLADCAASQPEERLGGIPSPSPTPRTRADRSKPSYPSGL